MRSPKCKVGTLAIGIVLASAAAHAQNAIPRYAHIIVIIEENHTADEIIGNTAAPNINRLAKQYGYASQFYAERHPSEPNYVAILGGDTFGIADDDAYYCKPHMKDEGCPHSDDAGYVDHPITAPALTDQLTAHGLRWKGYFESIPVAGSPTYRWPSSKEPAPGKPDSLYASKHNGFMNFRSLQQDPLRVNRIVGFAMLDHDLRLDTLPAYAQIVPNQCDDMHGLRGANVAPDCATSAGLITRGDTMVGTLVGKIMQSAAWKGSGNIAVIITFDENDDETPSDHPSGCCGSGPDDPHNPGGGWIPTIIVTNHGPRSLVDQTPYNHYSLLRTTEAALGITEYLGHARDTSRGVKTMSTLFAVSALHQTLLRNNPQRPPNR
jgi:phosphatidylinositol-3-phosphatase